MYWPRWREPASSSPSKKKTRLDVGWTPSSRNARRTGQQGRDRRLVVTGRTGVQPPLRVHRISRLGHGARRPAGLHGSRIERGFERRVRPVQGVDRLAVVVDVDAQSPLRVGHAKLAVHEGCDAVDPKQLRSDPDRPQLVADVLGRPGDILEVTGTVGIRQEFGEVPQDLHLVRLPVRPREIRPRLGRGWMGREDSPDQGYRNPPEYLMGCHAGIMSMPRIHRQPVEFRRWRARNLPAPRRPATRGACRRPDSGSAGSAPE